MTTILTFIIFLLLAIWLRINILAWFSPIHGKKPVRCLKIEQNKWHNVTIIDRGVYVDGKIAIEFSGKKSYAFTNGCVSMFPISHWLTT